jgi:hypothetical protein
VHWLFAPELQEALGDECVPFDIRGVPESSPYAKFEGFTAKTVPAARRQVQPGPSEVAVSVVQRGRPKQLSIDPFYLVPWAPVVGNRVAIVGRRWIGQVGKLVKRDDESCAVELDLSGEVSYFAVKDVVNVLKK